MKIKKGKDKSYAKHYASYQPSYISAFIRSQPLKHTVYNKRQHHKYYNSKLWNTEHTYNGNADKNAN